MFNNFALKNSIFYSLDIFDKEKIEKKDLHASFAASAAAA